MVKKHPKSIIRILPEDIIHKYNVIQIEPINYVYYIDNKQYNVTKFICEILVDE